MDTVTKVFGLNGFNLFKVVLIKQNLIHQMPISN
jgi:hypothetical protein